jgi:DNA-binding NarL/FixJ family response regulator
MYLCLRTVESHLHNAYIKLGLSGQRELTGALDRSTT